MTNEMCLIFMCLGSSPSHITLIYITIFLLPP